MVFLHEMSHQCDPWYFIILDEVCVDFCQVLWKHFLLECVCHQDPKEVFAIQWLIHNVQNSLKFPYGKRARTRCPFTSCVRDQDTTTAPARHMWETGSLNWAQFMLQQFIRFPGFAEFSEFLFHLGKTPVFLSHTCKDILVHSVIIKQM